MAPPDFFETIPHENYPSFKGVLNYFDDKITATTTEHPPPRLCIITRYAMELRISNGFHTPVVWGKTCKVDSGLKRKHHFNCFIFQKNIRFIAKCFIVSCLIFLSNDAEKEIMRQQDQNTRRLRTSTAIAGKNKTGTRVRRVPAKGGMDIQHDRSTANHQPRLVSRNNQLHSTNRSRPIGPTKADQSESASISCFRFLITTVTGLA